MRQRLSKSKFYVPYSSNVKAIRKWKLNFYIDWLNLDFYGHDRADIIAWCSENITGPWSVAGITFKFKDEEQAMGFKLKWL